MPNALTALQVINIGVMDGGVIEVGEIRFYGGPASGPNQSAYWGSLFYFIGAVLFQFAVLVPVTLGHISPSGKTLLEWLPQAAGGCCFTVAAWIEWRHNRHATWRKHVWWLCITYLGGSILFWFAASCGLYKSAFQIDSQAFSLWLVDCPYAVGSMLFWVGAWFQMQARHVCYFLAFHTLTCSTLLCSALLCSLARLCCHSARAATVCPPLQMWKAEQFGLGFMSDLKISVAAEFQKGRRTWDWTDRLLLQIATWYATCAPRANFELATVSPAILPPFAVSPHGASEFRVRGRR